MFEIDFGTTMLLLVIVAFFVIALIGKCILFLRWFLEEKRYLDNEIRRASGSERAYWVRKRRRMWWSLLLPFGKQK